MYKKILVPTDGSEAGTRAIEIAGDLAKTYNAELITLHVVDPTEESPDWLRYSDAQGLGFYLPPGSLSVVPEAEGDRHADPTPLQEAMENGRKAARHIVDSAKLKAEERGADSVKTMIDEGDPASRILDTAKSQDADLIVMGNRGYGNIRSLFAGSVSNEVAKSAQCPCIAVT